MDNPTLYEKSCLNCGAPMAEGQQFCGRCGQRSRSNPLPIKEFIGDFFQDYFTVDAKFFRSVYLLIVNPGLMTRRFNEGHRLSYIAPFRLYIFVSFLYFFLLAINTRDANFDFLGTRENPEMQLAQLDSLVADSVRFDNLEQFRQAYLQVRAQTADSLGRNMPDYVIDLDESGPDKNALSAILEERWKSAKKNPERFKQGLFKAVSIGVFFLLPIFAFILMLTHLRQSKFYVNHLVLSVHYHTFLFLLFCLYLLLGMWLPGVKHWVLFVGCMAYFAVVVRQAWMHRPAGWFRRTIMVILMLLFLTILLPVVLSEPGSTDVFLLFALSSAYFTLALMNAYRESFLKSVVKHLLIMPIYSIVIALTLTLVAVAGVLLS